MKMKEIKKKFKRFLAGGLMVCLMMPSFAGATWADVETYDYTGITRECFIDMDLDALQEQIEYAVSYDVRFNSSVMKFDSGDEELVKQYEKLFFDNHKEEPLYYVDYKFQEGILPVGSKVSVFVRKQRPDSVVETQPAETEGSEIQVATPAEASATETERAETAPMDTSVENRLESEQEESSTEAEREITETGTSETTTRGVVQIEMPGESSAEAETTQAESGETEASQSVSAETGTIQSEITQTVSAETETTQTEPIGTETNEAMTPQQPPLENTETILADSKPSGTSGGSEPARSESETLSTTSSASVPTASEAVPPAETDATETAAVAKENQYETATGSDAGRQKIEDYKITGKEEIILFFQNKSIDDYIFQIRIGNRQTGKIYVPSASVLLEEAGLEKKRLEALESTAESESTEGVVTPGGGNGSGGTSGNAGRPAETPDGTVTDPADTTQAVPDSSEEAGGQSNGQAGQESEAGTADQNNGNQEPSGNEPEPAPEANSPATDDKTQQQETNAPAADDNPNAPEANAPAADDNPNAPEANAPAADDNQPAPEANAPADNNNEAPLEGLEVSISTHQAPRVAAPVAGEVNDEDFENRPDAGVDEEVSYTSDYVVSTDPNEELGTVLEALLYKEKNSVIRYSLLSSSRGTSGASITFLMSEIGHPFTSGTGGSLTIRKELNSNEGTVPQGIEYTYDVTITDINPSAAVTLDGEELPVTGGTLETTITIGVGESKTLEGLTSGSSYTVTQTGIAEETMMASDEIIIEGGEGIIDYETSTVTGTIQTSNILGEGEIVWNKNDNTWHDEAGNQIDVGGILGDNFQWYKDWWGSNGTVTEKISMANLLESVKDNAEKVTFHVTDGGLDVFYEKQRKEMNSYYNMWYSVMKTMYGRQNTHVEKNCYSKEEIEDYLGDHLIAWEYDANTKDDTTLVYYTRSWRVRPADPLNLTDFVKAQAVTITYTGSHQAAKANLVLRKQLVSSPDDLSPKADDENQTFLYKIENKDTANTRVGEIFYASITVEKGQTEGVCTITDLPASTQYEITELENLRYQPVGGASQTVNTLDLVSDITFTGYKAYSGYFSDTNIVVNRVTALENGKFQFTTEYPDGQPVHADFKLTPPPALLPEKNKSGLSDGGEAKSPAA